MLASPSVGIRAAMLGGLLVLGAACLSTQLYGWLLDILAGHVFVQPSTRRPHRNVCPPPMPPAMQLEGPGGIDEKVDVVLQPANGLPMYVIPRASIPAVRK